MYTILYPCAFSCFCSILLRIKLLCCSIRSSSGTTCIIFHMRIQVPSIVLLLDLCLHYPSHSTQGEETS